MTSAFPILIVLFTSFLGGVAALLIKKASQKFSFNISLITKNKLLIIGFFLYIITSILFLVALKFGSLVELFPLTSTTYIWSVILSAKFLKEKINIYKILGIAVIILGAFFIVH
ncbi:MAG: EamA family transporter [Candidatus Woesearchaeota archaeon]